MADRKATSQQKEDLREFLISTRDNFEQYHARKENMAWLATTVYLGGLLALDNLAVGNPGLFSSNTTLFFKWGLIIMMGISCFAAFVFIRKQSADRTIAAHIIASCGEVLGQLVDPEYELTKNLLKVYEYEELGHFYLYPKILIERLMSPVRQARRILWNYVAPYIVVVMWTIASVVFVASR